MTVEVTRENTGHWKFALGPVEKWVVATGAAVLLSAGYWFVSNVGQRLDQLSAASNSMATAQAVTNSQLTTLNVQLADIPSVARRIAEHEVRMKRLEEDVKEVRTMKGLK